uniref:Ionotropic receptor IR42 n=1 Tax=Lobesia botrana TaxID=209534 RepID=A0A345BF49_9NEOP|nr:ionotropic receptor IR42 [Lobesia botrana]
MLNATPTPVFTNRFGYFVNGQWTGVINELIQNKGDIGERLLKLIFRYFDICKSIHHDMNMSHYFAPLWKENKVLLN